MINIPFKLSVVVTAAMLYTAPLLAEEAPASAHASAIEAPKAKDAKVVHKKNVVSDEVKKELEEYHKKKKELWEALSPDAKKAISAHRHRPSGAHNKHHPIKPIAAEPDNAVPADEIKY